MLNKIHEKNKKNIDELNHLDTNIEKLKLENNKLERKLHDLILEIKSKKHEQICNTCHINSIINQMNICKILVDNEIKSKHIYEEVKVCEEKVKKELKNIDSSIKELRDKRKLINVSMINNDAILEKLYILKHKNDEETHNMKKQYDVYKGIQKQNISINSKINQIIQ